MKEFQTRNNSELVAIFGNFVNRVMVLTDKYYEGKVPISGKINQIDQEVLNSIKITTSKLEKKIDSES